MKLVTLILLFSVIQPAKSQDSLYSKESFNVHIMTLCIIHPQPRYRIGFEYTKDRLGYSLDIGFANAFSVSWLYEQRDRANNYRFFEFRPEIKYYLLKADFAKFYNAVELFHCYSTENLFDSYFISHQSSIRYDRAKMHKYLFGIHYKVGVSSMLSEHIDLDVYFGTGYVRRIFNYSNLSNARLSNEFFEEEWFPQNSRYERATDIWHFTFGCKLGYTF